MLPTTFNIFTPTAYFTVEKQYGNSGTITKKYGNFAKCIFPSRIRKFSKNRFENQNLVSCKGADF